ncbi:MAG: DUF4142 domain-containing protein [Thermoleophilaceae bacterium]
MRGAIAALVIFAAVLAGCGGGSGGSDSGKSKSSASSSTTPPSHGQTIVPRSTAPATAPLPGGDAGFLTAELERATLESLVAGIASGRGTGAVKSYAKRVLRERAKIAQEDAALAKQLKATLRPRAIGAAERDALRKLVPLTGSRFDAAYLSLESKNIGADASRAASAAKSARSAKVKSAAARHLAVYQAELRAARS